MKVRNLFLFFLALIVAVSCNDDDNTDTAKIKAMAKEAYIYAFAAVENNKAIGQILNSNPNGVNKFNCMTTLATPNDKTVITPNNDTYYGYAVLDLRYEPVVISIPEIDDRYFSIQLVDIFTNCPNYVKPIATGTGMGNYLVAPVDWEGVLPEGIDKVIPITSTIVFVLARTQALVVPDQNALDLQTKYKIEPLSQFTGGVAPDKTPLEWPAIYSAKTGDVETFFNIFNYMIQYQVLTDDDVRLMNKYAEIGLEPGKEFKKELFDKETWSAIEAGAFEGREVLSIGTKNTNRNENGWGISPECSGKWGTDYLARALVAWQYIYVNTHEEAIYYTGMVDKDMNPLNGAANRYTITFPPNGLPTPYFFWSLTMYNEEGYLSENSIKRYILNSSSALNTEADGSTVLYIQKENPGGGREANWLPAPDGAFYVVFRMYGPDDSIISGQYVLPGLEKK